MIIVEKNAGPKIPYEVEDTYLTFDDELTLKLSKYQREDTVHKTICYDAEGDLMIGTAGARRYVAEIDIPGFEYEIEGEGDEQTRTQLPLDMDKVTLTLWAIE